jgi:hypothetical protein
VEQKDGPNRVDALLRDAHALLVRVRRRGVRGRTRGQAVAPARNAA